MTANNRELVLRFFDEVERRQNVGAIPEFFAEDFVNHGAPPGISPDRDGVIKLYTGLFKAFSKFTVEIHHCVAEGDLVIVNKTQLATHTGTFMTVPATQRPIAISACDIFQCRDGKIVTHWHVLDRMGLLLALGLFESGKAKEPGVQMDLMLIPVRNLDESRQFYSKTLAPLGYKVLAEDAPDERHGRRIGFGVPGENRRPDLWIEERAIGVNKVHFALNCRTHDEVAAFHRAGVEAGGLDNGKEGRRSFMPPNYYGAFVVDPNGHEVEAACWDEGASK
jgi:predicted SnoaL-like aldol condensation-catalyzing enzyme/catechol 2,3-dioxygenase-like lactoylglutathione lyase family enzyme